MVVYTNPMPLLDFDGAGQPERLSEAARLFRRMLPRHRKKRRLHDGRSAVRDVSRESSRTLILKDLHSACVHSMHRLAVGGMMSLENKTVVRQFFQRLERDLRIPDELLGPDFVYHVPGLPPIDGRYPRTGC